MKGSWVADNMVVFEYKGYEVVYDKYYNGWVAKKNSHVCYGPYTMSQEVFDRIDEDGTL